jgi:hypothetical protein
MGATFKGYRLTSDISEAGKPNCYSSGLKCSSQELGMFVMIQMRCGRVVVLRAWPSPFAPKDAAMRWPEFQYHLMLRAERSYGRFSPSCI